MLKGDMSGSNTGLVPIAFKGPLVVTGWGYDVNGYPLPNSGQKTTQFADNYLSNPQLWKTGPVDLRWSDTRKVWFGGNYTIKGKMTSTLTQVGPPSETAAPNAKIQIWNTGTKKFDDGQSIKVGTFLDNGLISAGTKFLAQWDDDMGAYKLIVS